MVRGSITVTGTGFGTDKTKLNAWLTKNGVNVYQMDVLEATSITSLKLKIPSGQSGEFRVKVLQTDLGFAVVTPVDANKFTYGIFVDSVSPATGSKFGGTIITIAGSNFSPVLSDNQVYIGDAANWRCDVLTATVAQITCRTPMLHPNSTALGQKVMVVGRSTINSECRGTCIFTYDNITSPTLGSAQNNSLHSAGEAVSISGTGLVNGGVQPKVFVGGTEATVTASTNTDITFTFPSAPYGTYPVRAYVDNVGYTNSLYMNSSYHITTTNFVSSTQGNSIEVAGSGFLSLDDARVSIYAVPPSISYKITAVTPIKISMDVGQCTDGTKVEFFIQVGATTQSFNYTCLTSNTPVVTMVTTSPVQYNGVTQTISFTQTTATVTGFPFKAYAYLIDSAGKRFGDDIELTITTGTAPAFTLDGKSLSSGKYRFKFLYKDVGYAQSDAALEITEAATPTIAGPIQSGYNGGPLITVTETGLNLQSKLTVGGRVEVKPDPALSTNSELNFRVPAYLSKLTNAEFGLLKEIKLSG